jgi:hypothetical protein
MPVIGWRASIASASDGATPKSRTKEPRARSQDLNFLGPYDNFWVGCRARGGGGMIARAAGLVREQGWGRGAEGQRGLAQNGLGPYFLGGSGLILPPKRCDKH